MTPVLSSQACPLICALEILLLTYLLQSFNPNAVSTETEIEAIRRRAIHIIYPVTTSMPYWVALQYAELPSLSDRREKLWRFFSPQIT